MDALSLTLGNRERYSYGNLTSKTLPPSTLCFFEQKNGKSTGGEANCVCFSPKSVFIKIIFKRKNPKCVAMHTFRVLSYRTRLVIKAFLETRNAKRGNIYHQRNAATHRKVGIYQRRVRR